jgi:signal transduction histidine kinase
MVLRRLRLVQLLLALTIFLSAAPPAEAETPTRQRILFISSYHPGFPSFFPQVEGLRAGLDAAGFQRDSLTLDVEFMDGKRFRGAEVKRQFHTYLASKLSSLPPYHAFVVGDDHAFGFALDHQEDLFRGRPIVFLGVNNAKKALAQDANPGVVGVVEALSMGDTLALIRRLYPDSDGIHVIVDDSLTSVQNRKQIEVEAEKNAGYDIRFHRLGTMSYAELFDALGKLKPGTAVLIDSFFQDRDGRVLDFHETLSRIKTVFKGPIFALQSHGLGFGILGGKLVSHEEQGRAAAALVARILSGTPVADLGVVADSPNVYAFDHAEVVRLGIDPAALPPGARFVNRPRSVLDEYFTWMLVGVSFIALQSVTIVLLLMNNRERKRAATSLRTAMSRAEHANRAKSEFLSRMSHELRTPLNAIIGFSEIVKKELLGPIGEPRYRSYAEDIHTSGTHLLAIINDLLEVTKMSAGEVRLQEQTVDAQALIDSAMMQVAMNARKRGVLLSRQPSPPRPRLHVDPRRITQILLNLLSNAIKFTASGGSVGIDIARGPDGTLHIRVVDTGIGMSAEDLAEIVLPFRQVETAFSTSHDGTGLGVPIALELARLHDGTILYESAPGKGTTATLVLPAERVGWQERETLEQSASVGRR